MRGLLMLLLLLVSSVAVQSSEKSLSSLLSELDHVLDSTGVYAKQKESRIVAMRQQLANCKGG